MVQTTLSVVLEVQPASAGLLSSLIEDFKKFEDQGDYGYLKSTVASLHFMSISVFEGADYDPVFVIEVNFDGAARILWQQLEAAHRDRLRAMVRCCKRPADHNGGLYDDVTRAQSTTPVAAYLEAKALRPSIFHHGNRGLDRARILQEGKLFLKTRVALAQPDPDIPNPYRSMTAQQIHQNLRAALLPEFSWLSSPAPPRIPVTERAKDFLALGAFVVAALFILSLPGLVLAPLMLTVRFVILFAILMMIAGITLYRMRAPLAGKAAPTRSGGLTPHSLSSELVLSPGTQIGLIFWIAVFLMAYFVVTWLVGSLLVMIFTGLSYHAALWPTFRAVGLSLLFSVPLSALVIVTWLRWLERRDSSHDAPPIDERMMREMTRREDWIVQNHMGSVVLVKPGVLRMALFRAGHLALHLVLRVVATDGYLGSMRTVHFAHWVFINNSGRLMFFSNFDHSWDSYLDDFIEKAHGGLTLAWGSGVGFPPTRFLVLDGASHGRQFKAWARHSMAVSRFWFSAYKDFTVDQIERNARIAEGLRKPSLTRGEAAIWARDL
jgi:membrane protein implicated in regulation of membrane protease activity